MKSKTVTVKSDSELLKLLDETPVGIEVKKYVKNLDWYYSSRDCNFSATVALADLDGDIFSCYTGFITHEIHDKMEKTYVLLHTDKIHDTLTIQINYI